ncbi:MAG: rhodanese-like domain-containing protein [Desulfobacterales bacterium]|jgi:rhodanese-related sulfurtransferase|nr:hypothetical protein [Desulfobacter sp.]MDP6395554.1 rhodanese-like domain-containing protein [Desulfobacterales bacterium]MDP6682210.1 rhodanese-like domain-containing protein [Desulfobacterales bacterium]MDP6807073.1 rhodanese-like domain-containing protein [Desulfobacterales bacterium]|tara:strand:+ start:4032 stop:4526 length:495 start_codon:yes stop_codon:yes gene_type:complete
MHFKQTTSEVIILLGISVVAAFVVNYFSPVGIALTGQWNDSRGVISTRGKDEAVVPDLEIEDVTVAKQIFDKKQSLFVDARSQESYEDGHIKGAVSLPVNRFASMIKSFQKRYGRSQPIVTYCSGRTCGDSHRLAQLLFEHGFENVSVFIDGFPGWEAEGFPIE